MEKKYTKQSSLPGIGLGICEYAGNALWELMYPSDFLDVCHHRRLEKTRHHQGNNKLEVNSVIHFSDHWNQKPALLVVFFPYMLPPGHFTWCVTGGFTPLKRIKRPHDGQGASKRVTSRTSTQNPFPKTLESTRASPTSSYLTG